MSDSERKLPRHERKVMEARQEVEDRLADLRTALDRELKWLPRGAGWTAPLVGLACGIAIAMGRKKKRGSSG